VLDEAPPHNPDARNAFIMNIMGVLVAGIAPNACGRRACLCPLGAYAYDPQLVPITHGGVHACPVRSTLRSVRRSVARAAGINPLKVRFTPVFR